MTVGSCTSQSNILPERCEVREGGEYYRLTGGPIVFVSLLQRNFKSKTKQMMIHNEPEGLGNTVFNLPLSWCFLFSHFDLFLPTLKKKNKSH